MNNNNFEQLWKEKPEKPHRVLAKSERKSMCVCVYNPLWSYGFLCSICTYIGWRIIDLNYCAWIDLSPFVNDFRHGFRFSLETHKFRFPTLLWRKIAVGASYIFQSLYRVLSSQSPEISEDPKLNGRPRSTEDVDPSMFFLSRGRFCFSS